MSYSNMWEPEPPTAEEIEVARITASGGKVINKPQDLPPQKHYAILRYYPQEAIHESFKRKHIVYLDEAAWLKEVDNLARYDPDAHNYAAFVSTPAKAQVKVSVDVKVDSSN